MNATCFCIATILCFDFLSSVGQKPVVSDQLNELTIGRPGIAEAPSNSRWYKNTHH
jgi:hypothetical protein